MNDEKENPKIDLSTLTIKDRDIIVLKLAEDYYTPENANHAIQATQAALELVAEKKKVGIIVVRQPNEIGLMDDDMLLDLGLVKLGRMIEAFTEDEMIDFMLKLGFDKTYPFQKVPNPKEVHEKELDIKFIVYTNEENSLEYLAKQYGVDVRECMDSNSDKARTSNLKLYYHLYPRLDNKWTIPLKKGK